VTEEQLEEIVEESSVVDDIDEPATGDDVAAEPSAEQDEVETPEEQDDAEAAVTEAEPTEAEPAPAPAPEPGPIEALAIEEPRGISWTPFLVYLAVWIVLCVGVVVSLRPAALDGGARWAPEYLYVIYAGIGMTVAGPLLSLVAWLFTSARREKGHRHGLFAAALVKGSVVTFTGALLWFISLYVLDMLASGSLI